MAHLTSHGPWFAPMGGRLFPSVPIVSLPAPPSSVRGRRFLPQSKRRRRAAHSKSPTRHGHAAPRDAPVFRPHMRAGLLRCVCVWSSNQEQHTSGGRRVGYEYRRIGSPPARRASGALRRYIIRAWKCRVVAALSCVICTTRPLSASLFTHRPPCHLHLANTNQWELPSSRSLLI